MDRNTVTENIRFWQERIGEASAKWGGCEICAVSKTVDAEIVNYAYEAGIRTIGENRVQELMSKHELLNPGFQRHIIGALQTNKVKYLIGCADMIQSVDRDALAEEISRRAAAQDTVMPVLVQVNIAKETQKSGIYEEELLPFLKRCAALPGIEVKGLMSIMPFVDDPEEIRPYFKQMRAWFDRIRDLNMENISMNVLSMGMSSDCIVAAEEGATMVRLGRSIFGARPKKI